MFTVRYPVSIVTRSLVRNESMLGLMPVGVYLDECNVNTRSLEDEIRI